MPGLLVVMAAALLAVAAIGPGAAQGGETATVEVRVWQNVGDAEDIRISARPAGGSWQALGTIRLPLDDGFSRSGNFRFGDISLDVPLTNRASPATVEVRVWQHVESPLDIRISARPAGGSWQALGTIPLPLDDGFSRSGTFRFGDISLDVPLPGSDVSTLAGRAGVTGYTDGQGEGALFGGYGFLTRPWALSAAADRDGSVVVADYHNHAIRRIAPDGTVTRIAGARGRGYRDGSVEVARFSSPRDVAIDAAGAIYVVDGGNKRIRKITPDGMVTTVAGADQDGRTSVSRDGFADEALFSFPTRVAFNPAGDLLIVDGNLIRRLSPGGWVSTFAGGGQGFRDGPRETARFWNLRDIAVDNAGNVFVIDGHTGNISGQQFSDAIRMIDTEGTVRTILASPPLALGGALGHPLGIAPAGDGAVYVANTALHQIIRVTSDGRIERVAGTGQEGHVNGARSGARFSLPGALAVSGDGILFVADQEATVIRAVDTNSAGGTVPVAEFEGPPRVQGVEVAVIALPEPFHANPMAINSSGNVFAAHEVFNDVRRLELHEEGARITVLTGGNGRGFQDGPPDEARFDRPSFIDIDARDFIYVFDKANEAIRRVDPNGRVSTILIPTFPDIARIRDMAVRPNGDLLLVEGSDIWRRSARGELSLLQRIQGWWVNAIDADDAGKVYFVAANTETSIVGRVGEQGGFTILLEDRPGHYGGAFPTEVRSDIAVAGDGALYVVDRAYRRVLRVSEDGTVAIVADYATPGAGPFFQPLAIAVTPKGDLLVSDGGTLWRITLP